MRSVSIVVLFGLLILATGPEVSAGPRLECFEQEFQDRVYRNNANAEALARQIASRYGPQGRPAVALAIVEFVQRLAYIDERRDRTIPLQYRGRIDWWQYPDETLRKAGGDCEDKSILAYCMLRAVGIDTVILGMPGHVAIGVDFPGHGGCIKTGGEHYRYVECTNSLPVGDGCPGGPITVFRP